MAKNATTRPIGTLTNSTQRQLRYWTSSPPAIRPTAPPATLIAAYTPIARLRGGPSGKVTAISDSAVGAANAPPMPCTTRAVSSHSWLVANPPSSEASENSRRPAMKIRRRPSRSPDLPPSRSSPPNASAYALTTHSRLVPEKPSAVWMWGWATLTLVASSTTMSWAGAITARALPSRRGAAAVPEVGEAATGTAAVLTSRGRAPLSAPCCPVSGGVADKVSLPKL
jgi:hypothetical protein